MSQNKTFNIVWVGKNYGTGLEMPFKCDTTIQYNGTEVIVPYIPNGIESKIITPKKNNFFCNIYPNPAKNKINILVNSDFTSKAVIKLTNITGQDVLSTSKNIINGSNYFCLNLVNNNLTSGIYLLSIISHDNSYVQKIDINTF